jgi:hypothetical protein
MGDIYFNVHQSITPPRELKNVLVLQHEQNSIRNNQPYNQCLQTMMGPVLAAHWRGGFVGHAFKYTYDDLEKEDEELAEDDFPLIALDLDTTSLGPLIAYLVWLANGGGQGF